MSRPRYYWYGYVEKLIRRYPNQLLKEGSAQSAIAYIAIKKALEETGKIKNDGPERVKFITLFFLKNRYTLIGAADQIPISDTLAKRWKSDFVYMVGKNMQLL